VAFTIRLSKKLRPFEDDFKMTAPSHRFYYGWVIVAVSCFTLAVALGIRWSFGVFYVSILNEYGWGRAETAGAFSLGMLIHGFFAPVTGTIIDRFGPRWLFPLGALFLSICLVAASYTQTVWQLYLYFGMVIGIGINTLSYSPHMSLIPKWFIRRRGFAAGLVLAGMGLGSMFMAPLVEVMIASVGWRNALLILAACVLCILVPVTAIFQRRSPDEVGQYPDGVATNVYQEKSPKAPNRNTRILWTLRDALCTGPFWWLFLTITCHGFIINMLVVHQMVHVVDMGYSAIMAASLLGMVGLLGSIGGILCGSFSDRVGREVACTYGSLCAIMGVLFLVLAGYTHSTWLLYGFVLLYGFGQGALGPVTATTTGDLFPGNSLGRIFAVMTMGFGVGSAFGAYIGGYFYDLTGSYLIPFMLVLGSIVVAALGIWMAAPRRLRVV